MILVVGFQFQVGKEKSSKRIQDRRNSINSCLTGEAWRAECRKQMWGERLVSLLKLKEGMTTTEVSTILRPPLDIDSDSKSETWHYRRDTDLTARVYFDKKLLRFRVESWKEPKKHSWLVWIRSRIWRSFGDSRYRRCRISWPVRRSQKCEKASNSIVISFAKVGF